MFDFLWHHHDIPTLPSFSIGLAQGVTLIACAGVPYLLKYIIKQEGDGILSSPWVFACFFSLYCTSALLGFIMTPWMRKRESYTLAMLIIVTTTGCFLGIGYGLFQLITDQTMRDLLTTSTVPAITQFISHYFLGLAAQQVTHNKRIDNDCEYSEHPENSHLRYSNISNQRSTMND